MHASEKLRNVTRTVLAHIAALSLAGAAVVPLDDTAFDSQSVTSFVRVNVADLGGGFAGRTSSRKTFRHTIQVVAECYARTPQDAAAGAVDAAEALADIVSTGLTLADLALKDYVTDSTGATAAGGVLRFIYAPTIDAPAPRDGWARRIVTIAALWWAQHEG